MLDYVMPVFFVTMMGIGMHVIGHPDFDPQFGPKKDPEDNPEPDD